MTQPSAATLNHHLPFALQANEQVLLFTRRHWVFLWSKVALAVLFGVIPVAAITVLTAKLAGFDGIGGKVVLILDAVLIIYWGIRAYFTWYKYSNDIWVVTNQRIIDGLRPNWFKSSLASADLTDVEDIAIVRSGVLATAFNFGEVRCQTAAERPNFILSGVPNPQQVLQTIDAARDAARRSLARPAG
ncbi:MAG: hypothetical protein LC118_19040 [Dehalococcoidia bacterium]|nr:hypothetical protein [Dehalococcoidia bacterium]